MPIKLFERKRRPTRDTDGPIESIDDLRNRFAKLPPGIYGAVVVKRSDQDIDYAVLDLKSLEAFFNENLIIKETGLTPVNKLKQHIEEV